MQSVDTTDAVDESIPAADTAPSDASTVMEATIDQETAKRIRELAESIEHVARCIHCTAGVKYRLTASGGGIIVLERYGMDVETLIGLDGAMPLCPNGHGPMLLEDEKLPAAEAISQVAAATAPTQPRLPGVVLPFNFEGAFGQLVEQAKEVQRLKADVDEAAEQHKDAVKAWKKAAELYTNMAIELDRRRREKGGEPADTLLDAAEREEPAEAGALDGLEGQVDPELLDAAKRGELPPVPEACAFMQANPGEACPLCALEQMPPAFAAPIDSELHRKDVERYRLELDSEDLSDRLSDLGVVLTPRAIVALAEDVRGELRTWIDEAEAHPDNRPLWMAIEARPRALGTAHIAGLILRNLDDGTKRQCCGGCGETILQLDPNGEGYVPGTLVGEGCAGKRTRAKAPAAAKKPAAKKRGRRKAKA